MPNKQSAEKRVRTAERNRIYNRYWTTRCKNAVKKVLASVESKDNAEAVKSFDVAQSVIDKAVVKGVMHRNTAARRKQMMAHRLKSIQEA
ncbi:30S ribosomal protein S20 [Synergistales bacterium]|nr:30S ribosomal protein S20 [Synergistales bacterium]